jgi:nucleoside-diphosphate-sugar epimerase
VALRNLVTGGSGFLGSHVVEALLARGETVRVLVRPTSRLDYLEHLDVELVYGDLGDRVSLKTAMQDIERVFHSAAFASDWGDWDLFHTTNVIGVRNLLDAAVKVGIKKLVHVSTTDVYGFPDRPVNEDAPYRSRGWPYGDTKIEGEQLVWAYYRQHGLPVTIVRPVNIYGPRSSSYVLEIADLLKSGSMIQVLNGHRPAGLVYVTNVVDAMLLAADNEKSGGQAYNICDGSTVTWQQYVERLADILKVAYPRITVPYRLAYLMGWGMEKIYGALRIKSRPLLTRMAAELLGTNQGFVIDKARKELGYEPRVGFDTGMQLVEAWLHQIGYV